MCSLENLPERIKEEVNGNADVSGDEFTDSPVAVGEHLPAVEENDIHVNPVADPLETLRKVKSEIRAVIPTQ